MAKEDRIITSCVLAYCIVGLLCFGWCYNHPRGGWETVYAKDAKTTGVAEFFHTIGSVIAGCAWPAWLSAHLSIQVTKWP